MYIQKQSVHRTTATGVGAASADINLVGTPASMTNTVFSNVTRDDGVAVVVALDKISAKNVLTSFVLNFSGTITGFPRMLVTTFAVPYTPTAVDLDFNVAPVKFDMRRISDVTTQVTTMGNALVPTLELDDGDTQYVALLLLGTEVSGFVDAQLTAYSTEYDFWQPTK